MHEPSKTPDRDRRVDVLFTWELGSGLGHATRMRPLVERALSAGLRVKCLAIRRDDAAKLLPCEVEEAPWLRSPKRDTPPWIGHLGDTLAALGWSDPAHLRASAERWRAVLERDRPGVLVMDSSPVALLGSQGLGIKRVWLADGWNTPPDVSPLPDMQQLVLGRRRTAPDSEPSAVGAANAWLCSIGEPPIDRLIDLFRRVDVSAMLTYAELDPHGPRPGVRYRGIWGVQPGDPPDWPVSVHGDGSPGVFAYLKPYPQRAATLKLLAGSGLPTLLYAPDTTTAERDAMRGGALRLLDRPVDLAVVAERAVFVLCHASPGMTGLSLRAGVPVVAIPLSLEQQALAERSAQCGAVVVAKADDAESIRVALRRVLLDDSVGAATKQFAERYADDDPDTAAAELGDEIVALARSGV